MSVDFKLTERLAGFAASTAKKDEKVSVICSEALTSLDGFHLTWRLEELERALFAKIPGLPPPSAVDNLLVVIKPSLDATAYVNELKPTANIRIARSVATGDPIFVADVLDMLSFNLGVDIPPDCGLVLVRSHGWRRALFYDLCPLGPESKPRSYNLSEVLAKQTLHLLRGKFAEVFERQPVHAAIEELECLIVEKCKDESRYQELFKRHPWMLGGQHTKIERHTTLDDQNIPDYTGVRASDGFRDIFEIKPPFMQCFRRDGGFAAPFNDAWAQAERYLNFARQQRHYLRDEKNLVFENPRCFLIVGYGLTDTERQTLRMKESFNLAITALTYEQVLAMAKAFLGVFEAAATK